MYLIEDQGPSTNEQNLYGQYVTQSKIEKVPRDIRRA